ncbi:phosphoethanolamine transferase [Ferrimonas balearica]|uniref:phosphoethanolamine transferase n=1 Tax=Ferrimonas balearica TaxID=44012 RepID=UPI001C98F1F2|nr:phosphoethanolamine--lipid A transferase [Ferrimonas balearica]MBY5922530.1 phosphoethanolamine--lipid A transferase [Ferrimonas balearica]MBY5995514.1 phosphoethanolamine--lipid A transferase [Ferrimonas balearica]
MTESTGSLTSGRPLWQVVLGLALYFALALNLALAMKLWAILEALPTVSLGFVISLPFFFVAAFNLIFHCLSWPRLTKPLFIPLLVVSSLVSYTMVQYGILPDQEVVASAVETNAHELGSYFSASLLLWVTGFGVLPALVLWRTRIHYGGTLPRFLLLNKLVPMVASVAVIALIAALYYVDYASVGRNNSYLRKMIVPTHFVYSVGKFVKHNYLTTPEPYRELGKDAHILAEPKDGKPRLLVLVIGETARAANQQLNGYERETNPYTSQIDELVYFPDVATCGTATAVSVPCMFSDFDRGHFDRASATNQDNLMDILTRAGIATVWRDNDGGSQKVANHISYESISADSDAALCDGKTCFDEVLLKGLGERIDAMQGDRVVVLHLIGSHGPTYFKRYPKAFAHFQPACERADIENCSQQELVNVYDNTLRYTDWVLSQVVSLLKARQADYHSAMLYLSDHGESLGEDGLYLHGMPYALAPLEQRRVPMMMWLTPDFRGDEGLGLQCIQQQAQKGGWSQDNFFHTVLGLMEVGSDEYLPTMDILSHCRG